MIGLKVHFGRGGDWQRVNAILSVVASGSAQRAATVAAAEVARDQLRIYPPYRFVSRSAAYGVTFFTDRQRRWFFAALRSGELRIGNNRTNRLRDNWQIQDIGGAGVKSLSVFNDLPHAKYVIGSAQSRHEQMAGWRRMTDVIRTARGAMQDAAEAVMRKALRG